MSRISTKLDLSHQFRARDIPTPSKDQQGIEKTVHAHVTKLHEFLCDWLKMKDKGIRVFKTVIALKIHECLDDYYPTQLRSLMQTLLEIVDNLKIIVEGFHMLNDQFRSLAKLQSNDQPVISTWSVTKISKTLMEMVESLEMEYKLKEVITENVAHCRDEQMIDVYVTAWEQDVYLNMDTFAYLFAEVGLAGLP